MPDATPQDLLPYRALYGRKAAHHPEAGPCFICEGRLLVKAALDDARRGQLQVLSLLCTPALAAEFAAELPQGARLLTLPEPELETLLGFPFHRGILACLRRPAPPAEMEILSAERLLVLPRVDDLENLGLLLRSAAGLGMDAVLLGLGPDPFERRSVRVSMGAAWKLPVLRSPEPELLLAAWRAQGEPTDTEVVAAALRADALEAGAWQPTRRVALVLGPEGPGLAPVWLARCDRCVTIPMARGMDSLNVSAAGAILMHRLSTRRT